MKKWLPLCFVVALGGCGSPPAEITTSSSRAQRIAPTSATRVSKFVGLWTSPRSQTVNDWIVIFTDDGLVAVDGPGLKADGSYAAQGNVAQATYRMRNGQASVKSGEQTKFSISADGSSITFETGIPSDAAVKLVRAAPDGQPLPSIHESDNAFGEPSPFTLASL